jgi:hypothetical protein
LLATNKNALSDRPVNVFVDEAAKVINDPFIQALNKGRGAKIRLFTDSTKSQSDHFDNPSPLAHRYSLYVMLGAVYLLFMGLTLPFPVPPQFNPVGIFIVGLP